MNPTGYYPPNNVAAWFYPPKPDYPNPPNPGLLIA